VGAALGISSILPERFEGAEAVAGQVTSVGGQLTGAGDEGPITAPAGGVDGGSVGNI